MFRHIWVCRTGRCAWIADHPFQKPILGFPAFRKRSPTSARKILGHHGSKSTTHKTRNQLFHPQMAIFLLPIGHMNVGTTTKCWRLLDFKYQVQRNLTDPSKQFNKSLWNGVFGEKNTLILLLLKIIITGISTTFNVVFLLVYT